MRPLKSVENYQYILNNISQPRLFLFASKYGSIYPLKKNHKIHQYDPFGNAFDNLPI